MGNIDYIMFPDASNRVYHPFARSYCGYGLVLLNTRKRTYTTLSGELGDHTIVYGETWAVYQGLCTLIRKVKHDEVNRVRVLVATDSKLTVEVFNHYIPFCWDISDYNNWKKVNGEPVANQDLYRKIVDLIKRHRKWLSVRIVHINSHVKEEDVARIRWKLDRCNIHVPKNTAETFRQMNALADKLATDTTQKMIEDDIRNRQFIRLIPRESKSVE